MKPPDILYKYCSPSRIDVLENACIRFTPPPQLNDVFEMTPVVDFDPAVTAAAQDMLATVNRVPLFVPEPLTPSEHAEIIASTLESVHCLCLADAWDNALMWSYYTEGHRGFVIGFDATNAELFLEPPVQVSYSKARSELRYGKSFHDVVYTKADYWKHEREWRAIRIVEDAVQIYLVRFPPSAAKEVILGNRISEACRNRVLACMRKDYSHVQLYDLVPHPTEWSLQRTKTS